MHLNSFYEFRDELDLKGLFSIEEAYTINDCILAYSSKCIYW